MRRMFSVLCLSLLATTAFSQNLINLKQWRVADGGNDHWYGILDVNSWREAAKEYVATMPIPEQVLASGISSPAYLATVLSAEENSFIFDSILSGPSISWSIHDFFWLGGEESPITDEFGWDTHEAVTYTNWGALEPNSHHETALGMWGHQTSRHPGLLGTWNDTFGDTLFDLHPSSTMLAASVVEWGPLEGAIVPGIPKYPEVYRLRQWKAQDGGNNHWYGIYTVHKSSVDAQSIVVSPDALAGTGISRPHYLLTVSSGAENEFIADQLLDSLYPFSTQPYYWINGERTTTYHVPVGFTHKWFWTTGEPFIFNDWLLGYPTEDGGPLAVVMTQNIVEHLRTEGKDTLFYKLENITDWKPIIDDYSSGKFWSILEWGNPFCGDVDNNQKVNVVDLSRFVGYLFGGGGPLPAPANADASGDGSVNIIDVTKLVQFLFATGGPLACAEW
jgi:Dockerin type I domain